MRRAPALLVSVLLATGLVAGCGDEPTSEGPTAVEAWSKALARLDAAGGGGYDARVTAAGLDQPLSHESGAFDLDPQSATIERTIAGVDQETEKPRQYVVRVKQTPEGNYLQLADWGTWEGCWLPMDAAAMEAQTGIDLENAPRLPAGITLLLDARVTGAGAEPAATAEALPALQFLGVAASVLGDLDLDGVRVPLILGYDEGGDPAGLTVTGADVLTALDAGGIELPANVRAYVGKVTAELALRDLGELGAIEAPSKDLLLAPDAKPASTCPANR